MCQLLVDSAVRIEQEWGINEGRDLVNQAELLYERFGPFELDVGKTYSSYMPPSWYNPEEVPEVSEEVVTGEVVQTYKHPAAPGEISLPRGMRKAGLTRDGTYKLVRVEED